MSLRKLNEKYAREQEQAQGFNIPSIPPAVIVGVVVVVILAVLFVFRGSPQQPVVTAASTTTSEATLATTTTAATTRATLATTIATTTSTTAASTVPTTLAPAGCKRNIDCGMNQEQRICRQGNVYLTTIKPTCNNPGKADASCTNITTYGSQQLSGETKPDEYCSNGCVNGTCVQ
jgi:hypothetical protein